MELRVRSDEGHIVRLEAAGPIVEVLGPPEPDPMGPLLGDRGHAPAVLLSLEATPFVDSSGLAWLVATHRRLREAGGKLVLHSIPPGVVDLLKIMRLDLVLNLADDESAALNAIRGESS